MTWAHGGPLTAYKCQRCLHLNLRWADEDKPKACERCRYPKLLPQPLRRQEGTP